MKLAIINFDLEYDEYYVTRISKKNIKNNIEYITKLDKISVGFDRYIIICKELDDYVQEYIKDNNIDNKKVILITCELNVDYTCWICEKGFDKQFDYEKLLQFIMVMINDDFDIDHSCYIKKSNVEKDSCLMICAENIIKKYNKKEKYTILLFVKEKKRLVLSENNFVASEDVIVKQYYIEGISNEYEYLKINYM